MYQQENNLQEQQSGNQETERLTKSILNRAGLALFLMAAAVLVVQNAVNFAVARFYPAWIDTQWYVWALTALSIIGVGLPVFYFASGRIPDSPKGREVRLKPLQFIAIFFVCTAAMYITNFFSVFLTFFMALLKGKGLTDLNPLTDALTNSNRLLTFLYAVMTAPFVEEVIFRKLLLDKLRRYGDIPAILLSAFAFGFFHMNLSQFFYATALGIIFAYVVIRTNRLRYSILLHIMINFIGTSMVPLATGKNIIFPLLIVVWVFSAITAGVLIFVLNIKKISLYGPWQPLEKKSGYFLNLGTILYVLLCLAMIVIQIVTL
ncbi:membrane protease YdiL (CAAX protease family) [Anaerotaenia torta]|uniref:CPBP family intramembrane glutamic endopeptidase n=1 Tax=Anaerotaenia torta TaxID=433293 RepID=UPI003D249E83